MTQPPAAATVTMRIVAMLSLTAFAVSSIMRVPDPLLPDIAREFGVSIGTASQIVTVFVVCYGGMQLFYGTLGDRLGKLKVIAGAAVCCALTTLLCAAAPSLLALSIARAASGGTAAAIIPLSLAFMGDTIEYKDRQAVIARFLLGQILGLATGQALGGVLAELMGWRPVFLVMGFLLLSAIAVLLIEVVRRPEIDPPGKTAGGIVGQLRTAGRLLTMRWPRTVIIAVMLEAMVMFASFPFVGSDLHHRFGIGYGAAGGLLAFFAAGALLYSLNAPFLIARLGESGLSWLGSGLLFAGYLALAFVPSLWAAGPAILLIGSGFYMLHATMQANATQMSTDARGLAVSIFATALFIGHSIGVSSASHVIDSYGAIPLYVFSGSGLLAVGLWFGVMLRRRRTP